MVDASALAASSTLQHLSMANAVVVQASALGQLRSLHGLTLRDCCEAHSEEDEDGNLASFHNMVASRRALQVRGGQWVCARCRSKQAA